MSVGLFGKIRALFDGPIADATQIATTTDDNSPRLSATLATIENNTGSIPQVIQDIANHSTEAHEAGDIIYDTGFDRALEFQVKDRTARTGDLIGDTDGVSIDNVGNINGWETVVGDWRNTLIGVHIAELELPSSGNTRPLLKWRSGNTSYTLLGVTSEGYLFINDPTTSVDSAVPDSSLVDGNILSDEFGSVEIMEDDHVTLEIIVGGTGAISFIPTYTRNDVTTQLNEISFNNAGNFNLNQIHLEHNLLATAFDRVILAHTNDYLSREEYTNDLSDNVESDFYNFRRTGEGLEYIDVDTPISFPQSQPYHFCVGSLDGTGTGLVTALVANENTDISITNNQITVTNAGRGLDIPLRFDMAKSGARIPSGTTYDSSDGSIILPAGVYNLDTSIIVTNRTAGTQSGNRMAAEIDILDGDNITSGASNYIRFSANTSGGTPAVDNLARARLNCKVTIQSDGVTAFKVLLKVRSSNTNCTTRVAGANIHITRA